MKLFVANSSKQSLKFWYRVPGETQRRLVLIPSGQQVALPGVDGKHEADQVIRYIQTLGGRSASELSGRTLKAFPGIIYSADKPVSVENYEIGNEAVEQHQNQRAAEAAVQSAKAYDLTLRDKGGKRRVAKVTEVSVKQEIPRGQKVADPVNMTVTVAD